MHVPNWYVIFCDAGDKFCSRSGVNNFKYLCIRKNKFFSVQEFEEIYSRFLRPIFWHLREFFEGPKFFSRLSPFVGLRCTAEDWRCIRKEWRCFADDWRWLRTGHNWRRNRQEWWCTIEDWWVHQIGLAVQEKGPDMFSLYQKKTERTICTIVSLTWVTPTFCSTGQSISHYKVVSSFFSSKIWTCYCLMIFTTNSKCNHLFEC